MRRKRLLHNTGMRFANTLSEDVMTTGSLTNEDLQLRDRVMQQLAWDSQLDSSGIGVAASKGVATLTGFVGSYADKLLAERAAKRVRGIRAVANDVQVRLRLPRTDPEIATDSAKALEHRGVPPAVQAVVHAGHITLTGIVHTLFERHLAETAVSHIKGALGVVNRIQIMPHATPADVTRSIVRALHREASTNAEAVHVAVNGTSVVFTGTVATWYEREAAEQAAAHAPGITHVENLIAVAPPTTPEDDNVDRDIC